MGDRTRNIWNDDDGESALRQREKKHPLRRLGLFLPIVLAVLAVVLVAAWRDGTGFDAPVRRPCGSGRRSIRSGGWRSSC